MKIFVLTLKEPPFVQVTLGPAVIPIASVAVNVELPFLPDATVNVVGLNLSVGAALSTTLGVGVGVDVDDPPPPPPQAAKSNADAIESAGR